jgi:hypothetical protein
MHETVDARAGGLPGPNNSADWATAVRRRQPPSTRVLLSLSPDWGYRRRRPTPGAEVFVDLFAGNEHTQGIPTLLFPSWCAKPSTQHNLSYLAIWLMPTYFEAVQDGIQPPQARPGILLLVVFAPYQARSLVVISSVSTLNYIYLGV